MRWTRKQIDKHTSNLPRDPGVYVMRGRKGRVLYVGKAKNLRNRVSSYFRKSGDPRPFVSTLHEVLDRIDTVITSNEKEALLLENEMIKKHRPPFNIFLRDDKNYLYLRIDLKARFPRLDLVRKRKRDNALYFGPHHSAASVRGTHALVNRYFGLRTCRDNKFRNRSRPCLENQMGRCIGPCSGLGSRDEYSRRVDSAVMFLKGRHEDVMRELHHRMEVAAEAENFEEAARIRDQMQAVEASLSRQAVILPTRKDADAVGFAREGDCAAFAVLRFESGVLLDRIPWVLESVMAPDEDLVESFLVQYYGDAPIPDRVLLPRGLVEGREALEEVLSIRGERAVKVLEPARGPRGDAVKMAQRNATILLQDSLVSRRTTSRALDRVAELLGLQTQPRRIEAFDMSNLSSTDPVGARVTFIDGRPEKGRYRTYRVRGECGPGDTGFMREVLGRRFAKAREDGDVPDLVLLDGGPSQLGVVSDVLREMGFADMPLAALAKSKVIDKGHGPATRSPERIYVRSPDRETDTVQGVRDVDDAPQSGVRLIVPPRNDPGLHLLMRLRDEAHRFAVRYQRKRRGRRGIRSALDGIKGLGKKRRTILLRHFGSVKAIRSATLDELKAVRGLPSRVAEAVFGKLHA